jgi:hypothetical protein
MPGPSLAPFLAAFGAFALFGGLVFGDIWLAIGIVLLVGGLLWWGKEALVDFDHLVPAQPLPAIEHEGPPPGVHVPGPSFRPVLASLAMAVLFFGLVFGGWLLVAGITFVVVTLLGWLRDARLEYLETVKADRTGHLENIPAPSWPRRLLVGFVVVVAFAVAIDSGVLFATPAEGGGGDGGGSGGPQACAEPATDIDLVGVDIAYDTLELCVPADSAFSIHFTNQDPPGIPHDVDIRDGGGAVLADTQTIDGGNETTYEYEPLAAGEYVFICSIHPIPAMTGRLIVQ